MADLHDVEIHDEDILLAGKKGADPYGKKAQVEQANKPQKFEEPPAANKVVSGR